MVCLHRMAREDRVVREGGGMPDSARGSIRVNAAVIDRQEPGSRYSIREIRLDRPQAGEVLVRVVAAGLCHTDLAVANGDLPLPFAPIVGGHEGAGIVEEIGPGVHGLVPGDHVVLTPPVCGVCESCSRGHTNLCDFADLADAGPNVSTGTYRRFLSDGTPVGSFIQLGTFAEYTVANVASCIRIDPDIPLSRAALLGCGVVTGWGAAVHSAGTQPGDTVVVVGVGGVGICAVQGARMAGAQAIVAIDPSAWKREQAPAFGATHTATSFDEAAAIVARLTHGRGAERAIVTAGASSPSLLQDAAALTGKSGVTATVVVPGPGVQDIKLDVMALMTMEKEIRGSVLGGCAIRSEVPRLLEYAERGLLQLDELVTNRFHLDEFESAVGSLHGGEQFRSQFVFD